MQLVPFVQYAIEKVTLESARRSLTRQEPNARASANPASFSLIRLIAASRPCLSFLGKMAVRIIVAFDAFCWQMR